MVWVRHKKQVARKAFNWHFRRATELAGWPTAHDVEGGTACEDKNSRPIALSDVRLIHACDLGIRLRVGAPDRRQRTGWPPLHGFQQARPPLPLIVRAVIACTSPQHP